MKNKNKYFLVLAVITAILLNACNSNNSGQNQSEKSSELLKNYSSQSDLCEGANPNSFHGYGGGDGTKSNPYLICTTDQFQSIHGDMFDHRYFKITSDLDFSDRNYYWGSTPTPLAVIDGDNHKLKNITIDFNSNMGGTGIFARLIKDLNNHPDEIRNLIIENVKVIGNGSPMPFGVIAAVNDGGIISNVHVVGEIRMETATHNASDWNTIGGLVGDNWALIEGSSFDGHIQGEFKVGGIAGTNSGVVRDSHFSGIIQGIAAVGGLVGLQEDKGVIETSTAQAQISDQRLFGDSIGSKCMKSNNTNCL
jgi:hypothetical protein